MKKKEERKGKETGSTASAAKRLLMLRRLLPHCLLVEMFASHEALVAACWRHADSLLALLRIPVAFLAQLQGKALQLFGLVSLQC